MRLHLFEFEDQRWFPAWLRRAMTSYLAAAYRITPFPKLWAAHISKLLRQDCANEIVDLGSGAGGPIALVIDHLKTSGFGTRVTLTDLYPGREPSANYWPHPVDAANVPAGFTGIRTMFAVFHHFRPGSARRILQDAFEQRRSICVFEATARTPLSIAGALVIPLLVLALTPTVRPLTWRQVLFTYLLPLLPLLIFWDGLVSQLRTYSVEELRGLTRDLESPEYAWEVGLIQAPSTPSGVPYLIGHPSELQSDGCFKLPLVHPSMT